MKILLIGMNGFLGKNLSKKLIRNKFKVLSIVRKFNYKKYNFKIVKDDIENLRSNTISQIKKFKPEAVINLAWSGIPDYSFKNSIKNYNSHVNFFKKIVNIKSIKKLIMIGSSWEYFPNSGGCKEKDKINNSNAFSWSKNSIYKYVKKSIPKNRIKFVWLRVFFMYGKFQKRKSLIPHIILSLKNNKKPKILAPNNLNDFVHVDDVCEAIILSMKKKEASGIFNVGSGKLVSVSKIYQLILCKLNKKGKKYSLNVKSNKNNKHNYAKIGKISSKLNWKPKIDINKGLNKVLNV